MYNPTYLPFWSKYPQNYPILLQIRVWLGRTWRGWTRNPSLIPLPRLMCLSDETILSIYWYSYHIQFCIVTGFVETATKLLNFATKSGLAWCLRHLHFFFSILGERQNCDVCNVPITMYNMQRHMLTIHKEDYQYTCNMNLCDEKLFDTWQLFKDHRKEVHEKDRPEMRCGKCGVNFKYSWTYNKHMQRANCIPTVTISNVSRCVFRQRSPQLDVVQRAPRPR